MVFEGGAIVDGNWMRWSGECKAARKLALKRRRKRGELRQETTGVCQKRTGKKWRCAGEGKALFRWSKVPPTAEFQSNKVWHLKFKNNHLGLFMEWMAQIVPSLFSSLLSHFSPFHSLARNFRKCIGLKGRKEEKTQFYFNPIQIQKTQFLELFFTSLPFRQPCISGRVAFKNIAKDSPRFPGPEKASSLYFYPKI